MKESRLCERESALADPSGDFSVVDSTELTQGSGQLRRAIFQLSPEVAYGSLGARDERGWQVPPDTPVTFDIRLLDVIKASESSVTSQARRAFPPLNAPH